MSDQETILAGEPSSTHDVFYMTALSAAISTYKDPGQTKTIDLNANNYSDDLIFWGDDNLEPQNIIKDIDENDLLMPVIKKRAELLYGGGLLYGQLMLDEKGNRTMKPIIVPDIDTWLENTAAQLYVQEAATDFTTFNNGFPEIILDARRPRRAKGVYCNDASECRMAKQDRSGKIPRVYVNANWGGAEGGDLESSKKIPALDPYFNMVQQIIDRPQVDKWIMPLHSQSMGEKFYSKEIWRGLRRSGWLSIVKSVAKWKSASLKNQIDIKYHIEIDKAYWEQRYPGLSKKHKDEQKEIIMEELKDFEKMMKGEENAGKYHLSSMEWMDQAQKHRPSWKITPIEGGDFQDNNNMDYADAADRRIIRAFGMHPAQFGAGSGKGSAGSGSDIRVATNQVILSMKSDQDRILRPFRLASQLNGWNEQHGGEYKQLVWWFESYYIARLDSGKEISEKPEANTNNSENDEQ